MYAPKLRDLTKDERWAEGFAYRIDQRAAEIMAEIKALADKARAEIIPPRMRAVPLDTTYSDLQAQLRALTPYVPTPEDALRQMRAMQNSDNPYNVGLGGFHGSTLLDQIGGAAVAPFWR